jgi:iron(III) transport system permease protein
MASITEAGQPVLKRSWDRIIQWSVVVITAILVVFPAWPILLQSVMDQPLYEKTRQFTLNNFVKVFTEPVFYQVVGRTVIFALATTALSVGIGMVLAIFVVRTNMPGRKFLRNLITIPYYVSPLVLAFAWGTMYGPAGYVTILARTLHLPTWNLYSLGGIVVVTMMYTMPYTYLYISSSLALADPQLESAARIGGANPFLTMLRITVPLLRPAITYSFLLILVTTMELLSIPLVLGAPVGIQVLSTYLYQLGVVGIKTDYGSIAVVSIMVVLMVTGLVVLQGKLVAQERRFVTVGGKATRPKPLDLGAWKWVVSALVSLFVFMFVLLPLFALVLQASTPFVSPLVNPFEMLTNANFKSIWDTPTYRQSLTNSLLIGLIGAAIGIVFTTISAITAYRSKFKARVAVRYLSLYPRAFPGLIVGIGFLWAFLMIPGIGAIRNTIWVMMLAFIMRYLPLGFSSISPSVLQVSDELDRAARIAGTSWFGATWRILFPILRPAMLSGYFLLFIAFLKEYSVALFLYARGSQVIGTTMIELWRQGNTGPVAALAVMQLALTAVVLVISQKVLGVKLHD